VDEVRRGDTQAAPGREVGDEPVPGLPIEAGAVGWQRLDPTPGGGQHGGARRVVAQVVAGVVRQLRVRCHRLAGEPDRRRVPLLVDPTHVGEGDSLRGIARFRPPGQNRGEPVHDRRQALDLPDAVGGRLLPPGRLAPEFVPAAEELQRFGEPPLVTQRYPQHLVAPGVVGLELERLPQLALRLPRVAAVQ
jgi:hypothetical protein